MSNSYSKADFLTFLDYMANKGLMKKNTVFARKASVKALLDVLDDEEVQDVRNIDIDTMAHRFANLQGQKFTPGSMQTYKSRYKSALNDFLSYREDPIAFTPKISTRQRKPTDNTVVTNRNVTTAGNEKANLMPGVTNPANMDKSRPDNSVNSFSIPIPLRSGCIIQINDVPTDLTPTEAKKIANVVVALATEDES